MVAALISGSAYAGLASCYVFLWLVKPAWPPPDFAGMLPPSVLAWLAAGLALAAALAEAGRRAMALRHMRRAAAGLVAASAVGAGASLATLMLLAGSGLDPQGHSYPATLWAMTFFVVVHIAFCVAMVAFSLLRLALGLVTPERRMLVELTALSWHYTVAIGLASLGLAAFGEALG